MTMKKHRQVYTYKHVHEYTLKKKEEKKHVL